MHPSRLSKDGSSVSVSMRLSRAADRELRQMAGYSRGMGRLVSELVMAEQARRQEAAKHAAAGTKGAE
jgi:hypothetical protein